MLVNVGNRKRLCKLVRLLLVHIKPFQYADYTENSLAKSLFPALNFFTVAFIMSKKIYINYIIYFLFLFFFFFFSSSKRCFIKTALALSTVCYLLRLDGFTPHHTNSGGVWFEWGYYIRVFDRKLFVHLDIFFLR